MYGMVKISYKSLNESVSALNELLGLELPVKASVIIGRNVKKVNLELENYKEQIEKLKKKYTKSQNERVKSEETKLEFKFDKISIEGLDKDLTELNKMEVEVPIDLVSTDLFGDIKVKSIVFLTCDYMFKDE